MLLLQYLEKAFSYRKKLFSRLNNFRKTVFAKTNPSYMLDRVLGKMPPGKMPSGKMPPGKAPPGNNPPRKIDPRKFDPRKIACPLLL